MNIGAFSIINSSMNMSSILRKPYRFNPNHNIGTVLKSDEILPLHSYNVVVLYKKLQDGGYLPENMSFEDFKNKMQEELNDSSGS